MAATIQQLSEKRKKWVEANRENGFEDGIKRLLTDLYPDNAHFIYELLQNAEDARATEVRFILNNDSVEFEHNGDRLFSIEDVESITSIGVSTKKNDPTSIGKFGVGFKAVFAYTTTPKIESGEYHFRIRELVVPDTDGLAPCALGEKETRMIFPFDNPRKPHERAHAEIARNLRQLNAGTLLFLSNIRKIEYILPDSTLGFLERTETEGNRIEISVQHPEATAPTPAFFLLFEKEANVNDEDDNPKSCRIAVAFSMEKIDGQDTGKSIKEGEQHPPAQWRIRSLVPGQVSIYFPADKETSNLRFNLHAPFASTVARDSIRDCSANNELRDHLANLIVESMATIRDQGLLTVGFLATLPNDRDNLSSFYKPILNSLIKEFQSERLTPMKQGGHAAANGIFRGPAQLSNLISDDDLATLLGEGYFPPLWVANPQQRNQREDNFLSMLNISEWNTEKLVSALSIPSWPIMKWLGEKTDEWHQQLYALLGDFLSTAPSSPYHEARNRKERLAGLPIVRISDGTHSFASKCYFPSDGVDQDDLMPRVAKGVYTSGKSEEQKKKAKEFLEKIGVREAGEAEQVEAILKHRYSQAAVDREAFKPDMKDIGRFIALVEKEPSQASLFKDYFIFELADGKWVEPGRVYLDWPFYDTGLTAYYAALAVGATRAALAQHYQDCGIRVDKIGAFAKEVGAQTRLEIVEVNCAENPQWGYLRQAPGNYLTWTGVNRDYLIPGLQSLLKSPTIALSRLVWQTMCSLPPDPNRLQAKYQLNQSNPSRYADSQLVHHLKGSAWVPQINGAFVRPSEASRELLPEGFPFDAGHKWLEAIEFGTAAKKQSEDYRVRNHQAQRMGFTSAEEAETMAKIADLLRLQGKSPDELILEIEDQKKEFRPEFPIKSVINPERRSERLSEQLGDALEKEYEPRRKSVRTTEATSYTRTWLRNQYTNDTDQMVCQVCKEEMPFKKRDGEYYFEAVEALSIEYFPKEHEAQFLALCPMCAAMYKEFVKRDESVMKDLSHVLKNSVELEVSLTLGESETSIRFVESHRHDLQTILQEMD
jgi:hypothetical protein